MPHRAHHIALGILGLLAVAALLLARADLARHRLTGPRWKRRLVSAGLVLLGALGLGSLGAQTGCKSEPSSTEKPSPTKDKQPPPRTTCYAVARAPIAPPSLARLRARLPALEKLVAAKKLDPKVASKALNQIEVDLEALRKASVSNAQRREVAEMVAKVSRLISDARAKAGLPPSEAQLWRRISDASEEAGAIAAGERGSFPFDKAGRKKLLASLASSDEDVDALRAKGLVDPAEAELWKKDLQQLAAKVATYRTTEQKNAKCYMRTMATIPARQSLERLEARLPLLEKLAAAKKLHPRVARKILARIEADVKVLRSKKELAKLGDDAQRAKARKTAGKVERLLASVRAKLPATGK